jgi:isopentenyl diphosphate isomerase/L-lactate dehydrogenase-like FMN-dependent dehydrogenase
MAWQQQGFNVERMRLLAKRALPRPVFDFADGGAEDEVTLRANESAFDKIPLWPCPLDGPATRDLAIELFGKRLSMPLMVGPTGLAGLFWPDGERSSARAAARAGTAYCLSHGSVCTLEALMEVAKETDPAPRWMQVFIYKDRGFTEELTRRAQAAGYDALVLTTDNQLLGKRERDLVNGFQIPPRFNALQLAAMATKLPWLLQMRGELPKLTFGNYVRPNEPSDIKTLAGRMGSILDPGMSWRDVDWLRGLWNGPLILKGVLHPDEARRAVDHGVNGVIVSNHGGRQLDGAVSSLEALPHVVEAVAARIPVLLDGGIRRGGDVLKALALGAACCLVGRPQLWGLGVAGEAGVAHVLGILRQELDRAMGLAGVSRIDEIGPWLLEPAAPRNRAGRPAVESAA